MGEQPGQFADASAGLEYDLAHEAGGATGPVPRPHQKRRDPVVRVTPTQGGDYSYDLAHAANDWQPRAAWGADLEYDLAHEVGVTTPVPPHSTYREPDPPAMPPCDGDYSYDLAHDVPRSL